MKSKENLYKLLDEVSLYIAHAQYEDALRQLHELELEHPNNFDVKFVKVGTYIDAGNWLQKLDLVLEGINCAKELIKSLQKHSLIAPLLYRIANGYLCLYHLNSEDKEKYEYLINNEYRQLSKYYFRQALANK